MIAKKVGWTTQPTLFRVAMGGFFHDIGKKEMDPELVSKRKIDLNHEEARLLDSHPSRGVEILKEIHVIPNEVLQIVIQHHENCLGQGFPSGLNRSKIYPMARLVSVANEFCNLAFRNKDSLKPAEAAKRLLEVSAGRLDNQFLDALEKLFDPKQNKR
jgi:putative nucleotidyltransferase with HDIG domain